MYLIIRTFTASDDAGNTSILSQTISVVDTTPPSLIVPEDYSIECSEELILHDASASDNCGDVTISLTEENISNCSVGT